MVDEKERKEEEYIEEIEKERKRGKGYTTILANIVGSLRKESKEKKTDIDKKEKREIFKKFFGLFKKEESSEKETIEEKEDDIEQRDILKIDKIKENEIKVLVSGIIYEIRKGEVVRFKAKDYYVLDVLVDEGKNTTTYHLKAC